MNSLRCVPTIAVLAIVGLTVCRTAHAEATISANPQEVVFYTKSTTMEKSSVIKWFADGQSSPPRAVYYKTNGAGETLFWKGGSDTQPAEFIKLNNSYEFCLWGNDHKDKLKCTTVTTAYKEVKIDLGFIKDAKCEPRGHSVRITFTTIRSSLPAVQLSQTAPKIASAMTRLVRPGMAISKPTPAALHDGPPPTGCWRTAAAARGFARDRRWKIRTGRARSCIEPARRCRRHRGDPASRCNCARRDCRCRRPPRAS